MNILLTEDQVKRILKKEKEVVNEAWYNTVLELVGWADPTGIADATNAFIYFYRGDHLFGMLSLISALPYAGDLVAKPLMNLLKIGKPATKSISKAMTLVKKGKINEATKILDKASKTSPIVKKLTDVFLKHSDKLRQLVNALPGKVTKGLRNTAIEWINFFEKYAMSSKASRSLVGASSDSLKKLLSKASTKSRKDAVEDLKELKKYVKVGPFSGYKSAASNTKLWAGMPRLISGNASVRALIRKTKWYLGLLDFIGLGNFVGPDELLKEKGKEGFEDIVDEYNKTDEARQYAKEDFGTDFRSDETTTDYEQTKRSGREDIINKYKEDAFDILLDKILPL